MKVIKFVFVLLFAAISLNGFAQKDAITRFFDKYMNDEDFTVVYISPKVFDMIATVSKDSDNPEDKELNEMLESLEGIRILTTEKTPKLFYDEVVKTLKLNEYELLMQVRDKNENVRFFVKEDGPVVSELLLLVGGSDEFVLMSFAGQIDLKKIAKLSKSLNIEGAEHLEELDEE